MAEILTFALVAPLGAMGSLAVGERRGSWDRPGRSAVLGLVAACLGLERREEARHAALSAGLGLAIRREGGVTPLLSDFHTAQTAPTRRNRVFFTRREELSTDDTQTILSRRDYRADIAFAIALWRRVAPCPWALDALRDALLAPCFVPYVGRKSCPLGLPMAPMVIEAATVRDAFEQRDRMAEPIERAALGGWGADGTIWADQPGQDEPELGLDGGFVETRRDEPLSRARWQFGLRDEVVAPWSRALP